MKIIEKNVNRMIDLIDDLLSLSRLERLQGTDIQFETQHIKTLIQGAINLCHAGIHAKNITVSLVCEEDITVMVDPIFMEQALINLVDNAVKYSPDKSEIDIRATTQNGFLDMRIKDQGCGIESKYLAKKLQLQSTGSH